MASDSQNSPFIKQLASSDKAIRDSALKSLRAYLAAQTTISSLDLLKLWKGLFYSLWMQDKPVFQQRLSRDLAHLVTVLKADLVLPFLEAFWTTMAREWGAIESLRMDKFMYLVRQYMNASFVFLSKNEWKDKSAVKEYARILETWPLCAEAPKIPNGLRYHVLDIYVDELEKVECEKWDKEVLEMLLVPARKLARMSKVKSVRNAAKEMLSDDRLKVWRGEEVKKAATSDDEDEEMGEGEDEDVEDEDEEWGGIED